MRAKRVTSLGCDIPTRAHAQDSLQNDVVEQMSTVGCLYNLFGQRHGYECHSSIYVAGDAGSAGHPPTLLAGPRARCVVAALADCVGRGGLPCGG